MRVVKLVSGWLVKEKNGSTTCGNPWMPPHFMLPVSLQPLGGASGMWHLKEGVCCLMADKTHDAIELAQLTRCSRSSGDARFASWPSTRTRPTRHPAMHANGGKHRSVTGLAHCRTCVCPWKQGIGTEGGNLVASGAWAEATRHGCCWGKHVG